MATTKNTRFTFSNDTEFFGTYDQALKVATTLKLKITGVSDIPRGYYLSESKGLSPISSLNTFHLRKAMLKVATDYLKTVDDQKDPNEMFLGKFTSLSSHPVIVDMYRELKNRKA